MHTTLAKPGVGFKILERLKNVWFSQRSQPPKARDEVIISTGKAPGREEPSQEPAGLSEDDLVSRALEGDREALVQLYRSNLERVYRYIYRRVGCHEDAEDLTSEVFALMVKNLKSYNGPNAFSGWLLGIARYTAAHWWQVHYRLPLESIELLLDRGFEPATAYEAKGQAPDEQLNPILEQLPPNYRRVLQLRFLQGYSVEETATEMGLQAGNVRVLQHRALKAAASLGLQAATPLADKEV